MRATDDTVGRLAALDAALPDHPVLLHAPWGHVTIGNSAALRAMGITAAARDPLGGWYGRDAAGRLDGSLYENAALLHTRRLGARLPDSARTAALRAYATDALRFGITSVQAMGSGMTAVHTVRALREARMPLRVRMVEWPVAGPSGRDLREWTAAPRVVSPLVRVTGRKYMLDGTPLERLALQRRPGWCPRDTARRPRTFSDVANSRVRLALGSDGPRNPYLNVLFSTTHANAPAQALTREQAIVAYTVGSAHAEGAEREKGTLAAGQLADLAVLSQDVFTVPPPALPATVSVLTMVGGRVAYDAGVLTTRRRAAAGR